ncbi:cell envelope integrity protein TolA [Roseobacter weihaiensis]|uniref:cell envelope integrity protein TolA n=1 Tax=Roseobacter weihaiensis TaxID=2763262 RepID=UPI001D0B9816|nr:energy transducer TonB [Roseobacter sp. H9]
MIASSPLAKAISILLAAALLVGVSNFRAAEEPVLMAGAGEAPEARVGSSFADMVAGTMTAETVQDIADPVQPDRTAPAAEAPQQTPSVQPPITSRLAPQPDALPQTTAQATPTPVPPSLSDDPVVAALPPPTPVAPEQPLRPNAPRASETPTEAPPASAPETLPSTDPEDNLPRVSARPRQRDPALAAQARERQAEAAQRQAEAVQSARGNAQVNNTQGAADGASTQQATTQGNSGQQASQSGNAAASNYPGEIMRRISRVSKPRVNSRGVTTVAFSISGNGGLASVSVARTSGSSALDDAALRVIQKAAPFPPPPLGAQRQFAIRIRGR